MAMNSVDGALLSVAVTVEKYDQQRDLSAVQKIAYQARRGLNGGYPLDVRVGLLFGTTCVARFGQQVIGFINYSMHAKRLVGGVYGSIDLLAVAKTERGKGVGRKLLIHAMQDIEQHGYCRIVLDVYKTNYNAIHLYQSLGFGPVVPETAESGPLVEMVRHNGLLQEQQEDVCRQRAWRLSKRCCGCAYPIVHVACRWLSGLY